MLLHKEWTVSHHIGLNLKKLPDKLCGLNRENIAVRIKPYNFLWRNASGWQCISRLALSLQKSFPKRQLMNACWSVSQLKFIIFLREKNLNIYEKDCCKLSTNASFMSLFLEVRWSIPFPHIYLKHEVRLHFCPQHTSKRHHRHVLLHRDHQRNSMGKKTIREQGRPPRPLPALIASGPSSHLLTFPFSEHSYQSYSQTPTFSSNKCPFAIWTQWSHSAKPNRMSSAP